MHERPDPRASSSPPDRPGDVRGALGGSRLFDQPAWRAEREAWDAFLATPGPLLVEIGFDHGRRLTATAAHHPGWRVAGLEVRERRVQEVRAWAASHDLTNLHAWRADARVVLRRFVPPGRIAVLEALFPDPWWNEAHRARRLLVDDAFLADAAIALAPGGALHLATDVERLAEEIDAALARQPALVDDPGVSAARPPIDQLSRREWRCEREGRPVWRWWRRRAA
jgi:tRNA (guanine-N(7)-)-methyltransferase